MNAVVGSRLRIVGFALVLSAAFLVAGSATAAQTHPNHFTVLTASAYSPVAPSGALQLSEADSTPLGTDEHDRTPGISHREWLENKKIEKEKEKEKEKAKEKDKDKAAGAKPADAKAKDSKSTDAKAAGNPKDSKDAPVDDKKPLPSLRKEQDDPKAQAPAKPEAKSEAKPDKTQPSLNGKSEVLIKDEKKNKPESKSKAAPDDKSSTEKPAEHHRFGWQDRP